jgi:hypothetical protein
METAVIRKRLNTFKSGKKGTLRRVSDDVVIEVLRGWEEWPGSAADYYREIGITKQQLSVLIKKGKNLVKSGKVMESEFKEIGVSAIGEAGLSNGFGIELQLDGTRTVKFSHVDQLIEFIRQTS